MKRNFQQGVALVVTLLMLSVITFMAITFLVMSRREKASVTGMTDQTIARFAAESAAERATAEVIAPILAYTNPFAFDLRVSTNYINTNGFIAANGDYLTNASYAYANGQPIPITSDDYSKNVANLFYNPRPPVFIVANRVTGFNEFRYYLDLNRNGLYDANGFLPVIGINGGFLHPNGTEDSSPDNPVTNFFVGDPEWIGLLERPEFPHSATNRFTARYAYLIAPAGRTLDLNYIHNQVLNTNLIPFTGDGFLRNQGVGTWELNLAAFLCDLNTNTWDSPLGKYQYRQPVLFNDGPAFYDAFSLLTNRYAADYYTLKSASGFFGTGALQFETDKVDEYSDGLMMANTWLELEDVAHLPDLVNRPWAGADNTNHYFSPQELFDSAKTSIPFTNRLLQTGTNVSSYDRYTFYRLLSQIGTDSAPERDKLNLNYVNVDNYGNVVPGLETRLIPWTNALQFFTNVADKLLREYTMEWFTADLTNLPPLRNFIATFGTNRPFGLTNIPVWLGNRPGSNFVYSPGVHRLLQLAANIYDATTNRVLYGSSNLPSVFRPIFSRQGSNLYITNFAEVDRWVDLGALSPQPRMRDLTNNTAVANVGPNDLVFGVPLVIGAKKGLPNFNEFAMQSVFQITRKLQVTRTSTNRTTATYRTNMMYVIGISNVVGVEAWNSYRANYTRPVDILVTNFLDMILTVTNDSGAQAMPPMVSNMIFNAYLPVPNASNLFWQGYGGANPIVDKRSFQIPLWTNFIFLPDAVYRYNPPGLTTNLNATFEVSAGFPEPQWRLAVTNRLQFIIVDRSSGRLLDYVQLNGVNAIRDLTGEIASTGTDLDRTMWLTNRLGGNAVKDPPEGVVNQIDFSLGNQNSTTTDWTSSGQGQASGATKLKEIDKFRAFFGLSPLTYPGTVNTNLETQVPFTPTRRISQYLTWQANDPLVHYTASDLVYVAIGNGIQPESLKTTIQTVKNIGFLNDRYQPWGEKRIPDSDPAKYELALKDPLVRASDDWEFPTNKFPNIGWLGRVHRGTPWQTVFLKSTNILAVAGGLNTWTNWTGNTNGFDATNSAPVSDRLLFDLFTTAPNGNATRGQLPVNQTNLAAWSAVLGGVIVLANTNTDADLPMMALTNGQPQYGPFVIEPAGSVANSPLRRIVDGISREKTRAVTNIVAGKSVAYSVHPDATFWRLGDILSVPELTVASPFLNLSSTAQLYQGISDTVYERIPQQILSLLQAGEPRFVIYAYGQALKPADRSIVTSGPFFGLCTNYQITAEVATRTVLRVEGSLDPRYTDDALFPYPNPSGNWRMDPLRGFYPPRVVIESYNILPPD